MIFSPSPFAPENLASRERRAPSAVPPRISPLIFHTESRAGSDSGGAYSLDFYQVVLVVSTVVLYCTAFRDDGVHLLFIIIINTPSTTIGLVVPKLSGDANAYPYGVHGREAAGAGPVVLKVVPVTNGCCCLFEFHSSHACHAWPIHLLCDSLFSSLLRRGERGKTT